MVDLRRVGGDSLRYAESDGRKCWIFVLADETCVREDETMAKRPSPRQIVMALFAECRALT